MKEVTIVGAGLVGSLWAVYLSKAGYKVNIFERRSDIRLAEISAGKSINLALSDRGWKALKGAGVDHMIREIAIPMPGRMMHSVAGDLTYQAYGKEGQAIYSVSRGGVNARMMDIAEKVGNANIRYNVKCLGADLKEGIAHFEDSITNEKFSVKSDLIFACDGAFSAIRYNSMQKLDRFNYSQTYIEDGYREILLPANPDGSYKIEKNALHIWPRGRFMLIGLPNEDGSFTCTLFMPYEGENSFSKLTSKEAVNDFFKTTFPDFYEMMPNIADAWEDHPLASLAITRCYPWHHGKVALMGDAAHATVPFYGQGMNAGFEDTTVMNDLMIKHDHNWEAIFEEYSRTRKPDGDGLQDLSLHNYHVMRDYVADPKFLLQKKIEAKFSEKHPDKWLPLYSMTTFSDYRYSVAWAEGQRQQKIMDEVMEMPDVASKWDSNEVEEKMIELLG
jgi:kynurenine 3-monooxygenase